MADADGLAARFGAVIDRLAGSRQASLAAILILAVVAFVPGFVAMAPVDGDEPGYAVAARAMLDTGDFSSVRLQTENDEWRPRGPYWVQAFALSFAGPKAPIWVDRVPSIIGAVAAALLTWWLAIALATPRAALLAGLFVAGSGLLGLEGRLATADAILLAGATLSAGALARMWTGRANSHSRTCGDPVLDGPRHRHPCQGRGGAGDGARRDPAIVAPARRVRVAATAAPVGRHRLAVPDRVAVADRRRADVPAGRQRGAERGVPPAARRAVSPAGAAGKLSPASAADRGAGRRVPLRRRAVAQPRVPPPAGPLRAGLGRAAVARRGGPAVEAAADRVAGRSADRPHGRSRG